MLVEAEGMDGGACSVELCLGGDELDAGEGHGLMARPCAHSGGSGGPVVALDSATFESRLHDVQISSKK